MYSYEELMNMDETRLRELASSMGMKKTTSADQQELAYYVIDSESENTAKEAVAKNAAKSKIAKEKTPKEKKTRAKRVSKKEPQPDAAPSAESVTENAEIANDTAAATDAPAPKKRGRKPKVKVEEPSETVEVQAEVTVTENDKEGNRKKAPAELVHDTLPMVMPETESPLSADINEPASSKNDQEESIVSPLSEVNETEGIESAPNSDHKVFISPKAKEKPSLDAFFFQCKAPHVRTSLSA